MSKNENIKTALNFANLAAGVVVGKLGSATASLDEIEHYKSSLHKSSIDSHIKNFDEIRKLIKIYKNQNKKIVFTNGCFDILHKGHVSYLDIAKSYGDILIVGVNSDKSVKTLKGENRPINNQNDRLIKIIRPHVLVKGGDYKGKKVVGEDIADTLKLVDFIDGKSTTTTIQKLKDVFL